MHLRTSCYAAVIILFLIYYANHVANNTFTALCYSCCYLEANKYEVSHIHNKKTIAMLKYMDSM